MTEQTQEQAQEANLSLQDIELCVRIIDLTSARGAIRGEELTTVGVLRDRLVRFLQASGVQMNAQPQTETEEAPQETAE